MKLRIVTLLAFSIFLASNCKENSKKAAQSASTPSSPVYIGNLLWAGDQDLVCEMSVDPTVEDTLHYNGKVYGFCGGHCKEKFQENPAKYVGTSGETK